MGHPKLGHKQSRAHMYTLTCVLHTCTHKHIDTKSSIPLQWQRKAEGTCMFNLQPSISACSCSYATHCDPQPPPSIPYTPSRKSKEEVNKACREWVSTYGGEVKPTTFLISQSGSSVMEVQHSKLILFLSWVYTWPFSASIPCSPNVSPFSQHTIQIPIGYSWVFHTDALYGMMRRQRLGKSERYGGRQEERDFYI